MNYPVDTPTQLKAVLRALRKARGLSQAQVGQMMGVTQQRMAQIEAKPEVATFDTIVRLLAMLEGRLLVEDRLANPAPDPVLKSTRDSRGKKKADPDEDW